MSLNAARVPKISIHGLRYTCASLLLAAGVPSHVVRMAGRRCGLEPPDRARVTPKSVATRW